MYTCVCVSLVVESNYGSYIGERPGVTKRKGRDDLSQADLASVIGETTRVHTTPKLRLGVLTVLWVHLIPKAAPYLTFDDVSSCILVCSGVWWVMPLVGSQSYTNNTGDGDRERERRERHNTCLVARTAPPFQYVLFLDQLG